MRLLGAFLVVALTTVSAFAEDAKPADPPPAPTDSQPAPAPVAAKTKVPLRVVRMLPESHQAVLFDKNKGTHVLAEVGKTIGGYKVEDIDDDEVTLATEAGTQIVLAAPEPSWRRHREDDDEARPARPAKHPAKDAAAPEDPYAATATPQDPYGEAPMAPMTSDGVVRAVESPDAFNEIRSAPAPS